MGKLSDILNGNFPNLKAVWKATVAAGEFGPIPAGVYVCHVTDGVLVESRSNRTPGYKIEFTVIDGPYKGRKLWLDCWLTEEAMAYTRRDLEKLGIAELEQLEQPLPKWIRCNVKVVVRREDNGMEWNHVKQFDVVGIDEPIPDPFAPQADGESLEGGAA
jgi:hypothetical protein